MFLNKQNLGNHWQVIKHIASYARHIPGIYAYVVVKNGMDERHLSPNTQNDEDKLLSWALFLIFLVLSSFMAFSKMQSAPLIFFIIFSNISIGRNLST